MKNEVRPIDAMEYKKMAHKLRHRYLDSLGHEVLQNPKDVYNDCNQAATAITDLLARAETAEARCKRLEEARENANEAAAKWEGMYHMAEARAEKAEGERDAAVKTLHRLGAKIEILYEIVEKKFGQIETCERSGQKEE